MLSGDNALAIGCYFMLSKGLDRGSQTGDCNPIRPHACWAHINPLPDLRHGSAVVSARPGLPMHRIKR